MKLDVINICFILALIVTLIACVTDVLLPQWLIPMWIITSIVERNMK